jgi:glycosyltransferase involved in cell wall biosynthesis
MKKLAFIKIGGLASGGIEKYLQLLAVSLRKEGHEVDYFYTEGFRFKSGWEHPGTDVIRKQYLEDNYVKTIPIKLETMDDFENGGMWYGHDFYDVFDDDRYDYVIGGSKGTPSFPFNQIKTPVIETIHGTSWNKTCDYYKNILITDYQVEKWKNSGGNMENTEVIYPLVEIPDFSASVRKELGIDNHTVVFGLHHSEREGLWSPFPLEAYRKIENDNTRFIMIGGENRYKEQAQRLGLRTFIHYPFQSTLEGLHNALMSLDVYLHGRADGEVCSAAIIEAMSHNLPIVSHQSNINNGHKEQLEDCGFFCNSPLEYDKVVQSLLDEKLRRQVSKKTSTKYKEKFDFDTILEKWKKIIDE